MIIFLTSQVYSHEIKYPEGITDVEYTSTNIHIVTYYSPNMKKVECTVLTEEGKPIGGTYTYASGGVARLLIEIPKKYEAKRNLQYFCTATD